MQRRLPVLCPHRALLHEGPRGAGGLNSPFRELALPPPPLPSGKSLVPRRRCRALCAEHGAAQEQLPKAQLPPLPWASPLGQWLRAGAWLAASAGAAAGDGKRLPRQVPGVIRSSVSPSLTVLSIQPGIPEAPCSFRAQRARVHHDISPLQH